MKIALISPKGPLYRFRKGIFKKSLRYMPLTLPTLAALVPADLNAEIVCIDEGIQEVDLNLAVDIVAMTVITGTAPRCYELAAHFRSRGMVVVLGGPHVTLLPDEAQKHADAVVLGYAENSWPNLLRDFAKGQMESRYKQETDLVLSGYPLPDRSVLPKHRYLTDNVFEATRACIHNCNFCVVPSAWGRRPFQKPIEAVVDDLKRSGARRAIFVDLNLIADRDYAARFFEALIPLRISWYGLATTLLCKDEPLLELAARSGCRGLLMGFESISSHALRASGKGFNRPDDYASIVQSLHKHGIALQACFVFGLDDDKPDVFSKTADLVVKLGIDLPRFAVLTPFPGTPIFEQLERQGRILHQDWGSYDGQHVVFQPAQMTIEELQKGTEHAWRKSYSLPNIWQRLRKTAAPLATALATNLAYRHYAYHLSQFYTCDIMMPTNEREPWSRQKSDLSA